MRKGISFICAVHGIDKFTYIEKLIKSIILEKEIDKQLIIVDQNEGDELKDYLDANFKFENNFDLCYLRTEKGLSKARNKGLEIADRNIICFPDDDCEYPEGLLKRVYDFFIENSKYQIFILGVRETKKRYKLAFTGIDGERELKYNDVFKACCSISIFHLNRFDVRFDESLGLGAQYKSSEDYDYVVSLMKEKVKIYFSDKYYVLHPDNILLSTEKLLKKVKENSLGHGAYFRKHIGVLRMSVIREIFSQLLLSVFYILNTEKRNLYFTSFKSRFISFIQYK
jgi:glycosyltransferase involved in cell wall biosynthesis